MDNTLETNSAGHLSQKLPTEKPNEAVEAQTQKIPNLVFLGLAGAAMAGAIALALKNKEKTDFGNFVGQWVPAFMLFGLYNKMVKIETEILDMKKPGQKDQVLH